MAQSLVKLTLESNQYERGLQNAKRQLNDFTRSIGINTKQLTGMAAAAGAVTGAMKIMKDAFLKSETSLDEWGRTLESSKALYSGFLDALNNSDISGCLTRMDDIVSAAREAYNALDDLNTYSAYNQRNEMKERAGYTKALDEYKLNPTAENKKTLAAANQAIMDGLRETQQKTEEAYLAGLRNIATQRLKSKDLQDAFVKVFSEGGRNALADAKIGYSTGRGLNAGAQYYYGNRVYDGRIQDRGTGKWRDMSDDEKRQFEFARALAQTNDTQIKEIQALGRQSMAIADQIYQQDRAYNRLAGNNQTIKPTKPTKGSGGGGGNTTIVKEQTELQQNQKVINDLTQEYVRLGDDATTSALERKVAIQGEIAELEKRNQTLKLYAEQAKGKFNAPKLWQGDIDDMLGNTKGTTKLADTIIQPIDEIRDYLAKNPIKVPIETAEDKVNALKVAAKNTADVVGTIGQAFNAIEDPAAKVAAIVAQAIANVALAYSDALAKDQAGKFNIWRFIAGAAAATISMATTIASIHQATGYSEGGIVKGNTYSNDQIPAMLNAGEVVLNASQQNMLAQNLKGGGNGGGYSPSYVSGEQIWIAMNAYAKRTGKGEVVTWR
jgi:hypothetical protein